MAREIPGYLKHYMARQNYKAYTAIDHASWRYIMRVSRAFFKDHAHQKYLTGLKETGITIERIPRMTEMDKKLKRFGWRVATVTGFIPPSVFLEFLSLNILPIACDMRRLEHLEYTPAPDIVHEAAGHAPIISAPNYAAYLNRFGEIARKAIFAKEDLDVYEAIKELSEIKESAAATADEIAAAERKLQEMYKTVTYTSEATKLARLGWWSIEYGLIGARGQFKIYGAGLLSSVGESYDCFSDRVKKIPLTMDCVSVNYDITKPQPQLFYVENFKQLEGVIDELSLELAYKLGGIEGLARAKRSGLVNTVELDSGLQISGKLTGVFCGGRTGADSRGQTSDVKEIGEPWRAGVDIAFSEFCDASADELNAQIEKRYGCPIYLQFTGPVQLSYADKQLLGHSAKYHAQGYGTPLGRIRGLNKTAAELTKNDLTKCGFKGRSRGRLEYESGIVVEGVLKRVLRKNGGGANRRVRNLVLTFSECRVYRAQTQSACEQVFFAPEWGLFDLACGGAVTGVFGGAADRRSYLRDTRRERPKIRAQNINLTDDNRPLVPLYERVRKLRESLVRQTHARTLAEAEQIAVKLQHHFSNDWLLRLELIEILQQLIGLEQARNLSLRLKNELLGLGAKNANIATLVQRGLKLIEN